MPRHNSLCADLVAHRLALITPRGLLLLFSHQRDSQEFSSDDLAFTPGKDG